jgi:hypothetical protein
VISVEYDDDPPWQLSPDGLGYSLVLANGSDDPDGGDTWRARFMVDDICCNSVLQLGKNILASKKAVAETVRIF